MRLIPRDTQFFDMFVEIANNVAQAATVLRDLFLNFQQVQDSVNRIKELERRGDEMTHKVYVKLNQTFITPFDREDIAELTSRMDDVLDRVNGASDRLMIYKIDCPPAAAAELASVIVRQAEELSKAVAMLEKPDGILPHCVEINRLENMADTICRGAIGKIFEEETDPVRLIKNKELLEVLESATDKAEDAANVLETVVLKHA
jgi:predicted phosphate transport protein (TIGR00153 family)